jgi:putative DNA primase/helicase
MSADPWSANDAGVQNSEGVRALRAELDEDDERKAEPQEREVRLTRIADIEMRPVRWLWQGLVPLGKVTVIAGPQGQGKSTFASHLAALTSVGAAPGSLAGWPAPVVIASAEDEPDDTIKPRLVVAKADEHLISIMDLREQGPDGPINSLIQLPGDVPKIAEAVRRENARLAIFDPVVAFLDGEHSAHSEQQVRAALTPLKTMAEETKSAVVLIMHPNKADGSDPLRRIANSTAFTALARSVLLLGPDPEDEDGDRRVLALVKSNSSRAGGRRGLALRIRDEVIPVQGDEPIRVGAVEVLGDSDVHASELFGTREERSALGDARAWLRDRLESGPMAAKLIKVEAEQAGHSWRTIERAKVSLGIRSVKLGGQGEPWVWALPEMSRPEARRAAEEGPSGGGGVCPQSPKGRQNEEGPKNQSSPKGPYKGELGGLSDLSGIGWRPLEGGGLRNEAKGRQDPPSPRARTRTRPSTASRGIFDAPSPCPSCGRGRLIDDNDGTVRCLNCGRDRGEDE